MTVVQMNGRRRLIDTRSDNPWDSQFKAAARSTSANRSTMMMASKAFYLDGRSKVEIAQELGVSRFKVARLLDEARKVGMVSITVNNGAALPELSGELARHLGLRDARVIEVYGDEWNVRSAVGRATGWHLKSALSEGEVLGLGWGRTLNSMTDDLDHLPNVEIIQLSGEFVGDVGNSAADLTRRAAALTGGLTRAIAAPFFVDDAQAARILRRQPEVAAVVEGFDRLTTAVVGVGAVSPTPISVAYSAVPPRFTEQVMRSGGVGEVCGILFAEDGHPVELGLVRHTLTVTAQQLRKTDRVIAAATGPVKAAAVHAVCSSGALSDVVVDVELAHALLKLPALEPQKR